MNSDELASKFNQEEIKSKQSFLQRLQILISLLVTFSGLVTGTLSYFANKNAEQAKSAVEKFDKKFSKSQVIAKEIKDSIPILSDTNTAKAKMALLSLYSLAQDDKDKFLIVNLAVASDREELKKTITEIIALTESSQMKVKLKKYPPLIATKNESTKSAESFEKKNPNNEGRLPEGRQSEILINLTPQNINGWIFLGRLKKGTKTQLDNSTIDSNTIPIKNYIVTAKEGLNVRKDKPTNNYTIQELSSIVGGVGKGSRVKIIDPSIILNKNGNQGVWSSIQVIN